MINETTCYWEAPITQPALTNEEEAAKKYYYWDESAYQADNTKGWKGYKSNDMDNPTLYDWNGSEFVLA